MRQAATIVKNNYSAPLRIVKPATSNEKDLITLTAVAWNFAATALWNNIEFSASEISKAKTFITGYLLPNDTEKAFTAFCQRVLLARQYVNRKPGRYIPLPSVWLNPQNATGYAGTEGWYSDIANIRSSVPNYKTGIRALAEAMLEISKEPTPGNYRYWKHYFIDHNTPGLLTLLQMATTEQLYNRS